MRPAGPSYEVTREWKAKVEQALRDRGMNRSALARAIGSSRTAITDLLGDSTSSTLVRRVEEKLWPTNAVCSTTASSEDPETRVMSTLAALPADTRMRILMWANERWRSS